MPALLEPPGLFDAPAEGCPLDGEFEELHAKNAPAIPRSPINAERGLIDRVERADEAAREVRPMEGKNHMTSQWPAAPRFDHGLVKDRHETRFRAARTSR
jgi:hypothetical protein